MQHVISRLVALASVISGLVLAPTFATAGTLFVGTDTEEFNGFPGSFLMKVTVNGANFVSQTNIPLRFNLNGLGDGPGFLFAGEPSNNTFNTIDYNGNLLTSTTGGFPSTCCNEEMQFFKGNLYHAHYNDNIQQIDPVTGAVIATFAQSDIVGLAEVGSDLWATKWSGQQVGIWDPTTNTFTPKFSTPQFAGALAYDPSSGILWVGQLGGQVVPYTLTGVALNAGFNPILNNPALAGLTIDTVDGLTFQGESTQVPEPASISLFVGFGLAALGMARRRRKF